MDRRVGSRLEHSPIHQMAHTDACKTYHTAYTTVSLRMKPKGSKHVEDERYYKLNINLEDLAFLCFVL